MSDENDPVLEQTFFLAVSGNIKRFRQDRGWSQDCLAASVSESTGLPWNRRTVASLERGERQLTLVEAVALSFVLRRRLMEFMAADTALIFADHGQPVVPKAISAVYKGDWEEAERLRFGRTPLPAPNIGPESAEAELLMEKALRVGMARFQQQVEHERHLSGLRDLMDRVEAKINSSNVLERADAQQAARTLEFNKAEHPAYQDAGQDAERKAAARLGVSPETLSLTAYRLWGRGYTSERERRYRCVTRVAKNVSASTRAVRGHVSRALDSEFRAEGLNLK